MSSDIVYMPGEGERRVDMKPYKIRLCLDNTRAIPPVKTLACVLALLEVTVCIAGSILMFLQLQRA
jgi:hypothetical protein